MLAAASGHRSDRVMYPAHTTSGGKALLAELDERQLRGIYPCGSFPA